MKRITARFCLAAIVLSPVALGSVPSLLEKVQTGDAQAAIQLIKNGTDVNVAESNGTTALHWAVHNRDLELVKRLIKAGADVNAINNYGASPLSEAAVVGDTKTIKALLKADANPDIGNADNQTALMIVARSNNIEAAKLLLKYGANVNATEKWRGQNAVIFAAAQSQPDMLKLLTDKGGNPNSRSMINKRDRMVTAERRFQWRPAGGLTALSYAARAGCLECAKVLLKAGADIDRGNVENVSPLLTAVINMRFDTAKYLVEAGANVNKWSLRGENALYSAVDVNTVPHGGYPDRPSMDKTSSLEMIQILLEAGANPNLQLKLQPTYRHLKDDRGADRMLNTGATPLIRAAKAFDVAAMELLLKHGALPNLPQRDGITPTMAAAGLGSNSIDTRGDYSNRTIANMNSNRALQVMLTNGGDIKAQDNGGRTALHGAAGWGWNDAVEFLARHGADMSAKDNGERTPLDYALGNTSPVAGRGAVGEVREDTAQLIRDLMP